MKGLLMNKEKLNTVIKKLERALNNEAGHNTHGDTFICTPLEYPYIKIQQTTDRGYSTCVISAIYIYNYQTDYLDTKNIDGKYIYRYRSIIRKYKFPLFLARF